jgi:hypothetical protein
MNVDLIIHFSPDDWTLYDEYHIHEIPDIETWGIQFLFLTFTITKHHHDSRKF